VTDRLRLQPGEHHRWRIVGHHPWGLDVVQVDNPDMHGVVDLIYIGLPAPIQGPEDFPPVGEIADGVVQGYMPNGQLRISLRKEDVGP
jgi:hypothetical protein